MNWISILVPLGTVFANPVTISDVEHEVLPVSEGYRVTLTYNLSYQSKASDSTFDVKSQTQLQFLQTASSNTEQSGVYA